MCIAQMQRLQRITKRTEKWLTQNGYRYEKGDNQDGRLEYTIWKEGSPKVTHEINPEDTWTDIRKKITTSYEIHTAMMNMKPNQDSQIIYNTEERDS